jgi:uncharacterized delta-60 repeat protein
LSLDTTFNATTDVLGTTFGGGELVPFDLGGADSDLASVVVLMADGRILVLGFAETSQVVAMHTHYFALAAVRLNPNGTPDTTFGAGTGKMSMPWSGGTVDSALGVQAVFVDAAGNITVALQTRFDSATQGMLVARINADGSPDLNFGTSGFSFNTTFGACVGVFSRALAVDSAGRIAVGGQCYQNSGSEVGIERLRGDNGALDTSFGIGGFSHGSFDSTSIQDTLYTLAFDRGGLLLLGGTSQPAVASGGTWSGLGRVTYDLIYTSNFEATLRGCSPPNCN